MALQWPLRKYLVNFAESLSEAGLRFDVSSFDSCLYYIFPKSDGAAGAIARHFNDKSGWGEPDLPLETRSFLERRFGRPTAQENSIGDVGMELALENDYSVTLTQEDFPGNLKPLSTSPELRAGSKDPLSSDEIRLRQCKLGELCWVAAVSRPDIRVRLAKIASRINSL